ncbi:MAG: hypothetical protein O6650_02405 [Actinobacteria bacterium]|nr:hypothetical protein [Actinomycetota bacterium]
MLIGEDFLKAEHKYRGELLRDQYQKPKMSSLAKAATLIVVVSILLAACGTPVEVQSATRVEPSATDAAIARDAAPAWDPDYEALDEILGAYGRTSVAGTSVIADFGVFAGPTWQPDMAKLDSILNPQTDVGVFTGPSWEPDRGRLETILNPHQRAGPR